MAMQLRHTPRFRLGLTLELGIEHRARQVGPDLERRLLLRRIVSTVIR